MKSIRKRKIIKVMKPHAIKLMDKLYWSEDIKIQWATGGLSEKEEYRLSDTLNGYANIIERSISDYPRVIENIWILDLLNYAD